MIRYLIRFHNDKNFHGDILNIRYGIILFIFIFAISAISAVNAEEINSDLLVNENVDLFVCNVDDGCLDSSVNYWYVDGNMSVSDNGSDHTYKTLKEAIDNAQDGDTIYIAPGVYKGENNVNLDIDKKLNLINWKNGDVIFDGEGKNSMFRFSVDSFNISGLTFKNGIGFNSMHDRILPGGLLLFENGLKNSFINATFINNVMSFCGVITSNCDIDRVNFDCTFINNTGGIYGGSLIYAWAGSFKNSHITCNAFDNTIWNNFFKMEEIYNVDIKGFLNGNKIVGIDTSVVFDENHYDNSTFTFSNFISLNPVDRAYNGKSNSVKFYSSIIPQACYYVNGSIFASGDGSVNAPFKTLKEAIDVANEGGLILIAPGVYTGINNTNLSIYKKLSFINWTSGDVIFDGEGNNSLFQFYVDSCSISGLTFKNGVSSILNFNNCLKDSFINATFINNVGVGKGIINFVNGFNGVNFDCAFYNNTGDDFKGCLIHSQDSMVNSNIKCYAVNNNYKLYLFKAEQHIYDVNITGIFMKNNRAFYSMNGFTSAFIMGMGDDRVTILNSVILDEFASFYSHFNYYASANSVKTVNNWFGSTRDNYMNSKLWDVKQWLFLDADIPDGAVQNFTTHLKFSAYDSSSKEVKDFDGDFIIPIENILNNISISSVNANLDKTNVSLYENFTYSAISAGNGTLIANWDKYTFTYTFHNFVFDDVYVSSAEGNDIKGDGSANNPFSSFKKALDNVDDGGFIHIAPGNYSGENNINIDINKHLNILNWTSGDIIFDAEFKGRIFNVNVDSINITGLTFINGRCDSNGGAISFNGNVINSVIKASFIGNIVNYAYGNGIYIDGSLVNSTIDSIFSSKFNSLSYGGALYINGEVIKSIINGTFENTMSASIIYFNGNVINSTITGLYKNNTVSNLAVLYFNKDIINSTMNITMMDNGAYGDCGAIQANGKVIKSAIYGLFKNNMMLKGNIVYFNDEINDLVFEGIFDGNRMLDGSVFFFKESVFKLLIDAIITNHNNANETASLFSFIKDCSAFYKFESFDSRWLIVSDNPEFLDVVE